LRKATTEKGNNDEEREKLHFFGSLLKMSFSEKQERKNAKKS
jgi:hypothetical protein